MIHQSNGPCAGCEKKLTQCDPFWTNWFASLKANWSNAHISWGFRGQADQDADYNAGSSKLKWPFSKHNFMLDDGTPNSLALDLFQINEEGKAVFDPKWYTLVFHWSLAQGYPVEWGGFFKTLKDMNHYQISQPSGFT